MEGRDGLAGRILCNEFAMGSTFFEKRGEGVQNFHRADAEITWALEL